MNFGGIPKKYSSLSDARIVVVPVPFDKTSTWVKGADKGPAAILEASANMELYDIDTDTEVYRKKIYTAPAVTNCKSPEALVKDLNKICAGYINKNKFVVTIGGNHTVSIGPIYAHAEAFEDLTVVQFDAHSDLRTKYEGSAMNHACVMARAREAAKVVQIGIRSMCVEESRVIDKSRVFFAHHIYNNTSWIKKMLAMLTKNVYITIDLDVFDSSQMPSTGTPEPGGMQYLEVINAIKEINRKFNIVGFDVVELCPNKHNKAPDFLASKLIYQILSYKFKNLK